MSVLVFFYCFTFLNLINPSLHPFLVLAKNYQLHSMKLLFCHWNIKTSPQLQKIDYLILCLDTICRFSFQTCLNPTFKSVIQLQSTSNNSTSLIHLTLEKLAEDGICLGDETLRLSIFSFLYHVSMFLGIVMVTWHLSQTMIFLLNYGCK